jgi:hypothetical protein
MHTFIHAYIFVHAYIRAHFEVLTKQDIVLRALSEGLAPCYKNVIEVLHKEAVVSTTYTNICCICWQNCALF